MRLNGKSAVIYGAHSVVGSTVARAFAKEGARVYLAGRSVGRLEPVAREILDAGGAAEVAEVDPLGPESVSEHLRQVAVKHGTVDVSLNLAFLGIEGAARLCNLTDEQFAAATFTRIQSNFVTMAAAARQMALQGRGTVLATVVPERASPIRNLAGPAIGSAAIAALSEQLRADVGSLGVRFAFLAEVPDSEEDLVERLIRVLETVPTPGQSLAEIAVESAAPSGFPRAGRTARAAMS
jgi:NADP-dependent 3-hydroxy acid dehydrogenase YdfG